jgi:diadenylate cyclase
MAESEEVDPSLGSRHRAALGMAKDSDAIIMVVSEETGRVSLAYDGQLHVGMNLDDVREVLLSLLNVPRKKARALTGEAS